MESGNIVEYIDRQKIICAVVLEVKKQRVRLLNENNREVKLSVNRLSHKSKMSLDLSMGRDKLAGALKETAQQRKIIAEQIDIKELWEILNTEQEWIDLETMTDFCFSDNSTQDHESSVIRAFFKNRLYFKFNQDRFFPHTQEQVEQICIQAKEAARKNRIIDAGGDWLKDIIKNKKFSIDNCPLTEEQNKFVEILKSFYLFEKDSSFYELGKAMLNRAGIGDIDILFHLFVKLKIWDYNENIDIYRYEVPIDFSDQIINHTSLVLNSFDDIFDGRRDLTMLPLITIDGQSTMDFDDALSIEKKEDYYLLGVHISDVGHFVPNGSPIDKEALVRGSSIYMPDQKIPMLPPCFAENQCSLKAGELRPAISTMIKLNFFGDILDYEIFPSVIKVKNQLTYYDVNLMADENNDIIILHQIAQNFRKKRFADGAVQISLPEVNIWINEDGELIVNRTNRESPGRMLVSEIMIMANWLMAKFLSDQKIPAIFRSQPKVKERLYKDDQGTLFQNWMQRKLLSRFVLSPEPESHSGLGLNEYVTATSPIRKYFDLITQRQIRSVFGLNAPCTLEEIQKSIHSLQQPMTYVSKIQNQRKRYWLLKYLEGKIGHKEEAIVLNKRRNSYLTLITEYMVECSLPLSNGVNLKPEDMIQVTIQHVNARKDLLSIFMG